MRHLIACIISSSWYVYASQPSDEKILDALVNAMLRMKYSRHQFFIPRRIWLVSVSVSVMECLFTPHNNVLSLQVLEYELYECVSLSNWNTSFVIKSFVHIVWTIRQPELKLDYNHTRNVKIVYRKTTYCSNNNRMLLFRF